MRLNNFLRQIGESLNTVSKQQAMDRGWFGPVFHGTSEDKRQSIAQNGFKVVTDDWNRSNGYALNPYAMGLPPPLHHLGYGVYFTTVRAIAVKYNGNTAKGLKEFYLDVPRLETINFASPNTMMKWWINNGYDFQWAPEHQQDGNVTHAFRQISVQYGQTEQKRATWSLTESLKSRFDAVWFKGKTMYKVLDGDQICVYDPDRIHMVDQSLSQAMDVGSRVVHNQTIYDDRLTPVDIGGGARRLVNPQNGAGLHYLPPEGMKGVILSKTPITQQQRQYLPTRSQNQAEYRYTVRWAKGGTQHNYMDGELDPA